MLYKFSVLCNTPRDIFVECEAVFAAKVLGRKNSLLNFYEKQGNNEIVIAFYCACSGLFLRKVHHLLYKTKKTNIVKVGIKSSTVV